MTDISTLWNTFWQPIVIISALISVSFTVIAYMLSSVFGLEGIKRWAKTEMIYALSTIFIVGMFLIFFSFINTAMIDLSVGIAHTTMPGIWESFKENPDPFAIPNYYLATMRECAVSAFKKTAVIAFIPEAVSSMKPAEGTTPTAGQAIAATFTSIGVSWISSAMRAANYHLVYIIYTLDFQRHLLLFIKQTMMFIFLPLGILLRTFPFTRGAGNLFIAVAIGMYMVYPLSYGIILTVSQSTENIKTKCEVYGKPTDKIGIDLEPSSPILSFLTRFPSPLSIGAKTIQMIAHPIQTFSSLVNTFNEQVKMVISELIVYAIFYPFVVAVLTLTFIKSFSIFLGTDVQDFLQGFARII